MNDDLKKNGSGYLDPTAYEAITHIERKQNIEYENTCVCCGDIIPEGRQVCNNCEKIIDDINAVPKGYFAFGVDLAPGDDFCSLVEK